MAPAKNDRGKCGQRKTVAGPLSENLSGTSDIFHYCPVFINLKGKTCVVVGGGLVAERKVLSLLRCGANVKIISPVITLVLEGLCKKGDIKYINRVYKKGDLGNAFMVIAATSDEKVNRAISKEATGLVNVVDQPDLANFIVPSVVSRGALTIAVSTSGASPAIAKAIRKELDLLYGPDFGRFLDFVSIVRKKALSEIGDQKTRELFLKGVASPKMFEVLRNKGFMEAKRLINNKMAEAKKMMRGDRSSI